MMFDPGAQDTQPRTSYESSQKYLATEIQKKISTKHGSTQEEQCLLDFLDVSLVLFFLERSCSHL